MKKEALQTMQDNYRQAEIRKKELYRLLEALETGELSQDEHQRVCEQTRSLIAELKLEREQMLGYMKEETIFVDEVETRFKEIERLTNKRFHILPPAPTNAQIDSAERRLRHFAQGKSFYKLFWVFFIGCFVGVIVERLWAFIRYGQIEPRVGLIYGPFNLVYGIGAWALTWALYQFRNRTRLLSFLGGAVIGSVVEYACSFFQEMVFGSVSWDYSNQPFNLNGRICLLYSIYWGVLGVIWIKDLYPRMAKAILRIPNRVGKPLTIALAVFMVFNTLMTGISVLRWAERRSGVEPGNAVEAYFDAHYPDERMQKIFSNLEFTDGEPDTAQEPAQAE